VSSTDVAAFVEQLHAAAAASVQAQAHRDATAALQLASSSSQASEWEAAKSTLLAALGIGLPAAPPQGLTGIVAGLLLRQQQQQGSGGGGPPGGDADASASAFTRPLAETFTGSASQSVAGRVGAVGSAGGGSSGLLSLAGSGGGGVSAAAAAAAAAFEDAAAGNSALLHGGGGSSLDPYARELADVIQPLSAALQDAAPAAVVSRLAQSVMRGGGGGAGGGSSRFAVINALSAVSEGSSVDGG
jgi:hypothetical protein